jgi:hypothetical protein
MHLYQARVHGEVVVMLRRDGELARDVQVGALHIDVTENDKKEREEGAEEEHDGEGSGETEHAVETVHEGARQAFPRRDWFLLRNVEHFAWGGTEGGREQEKEEKEEGVLKEHKHDI